MFPQRHKSDAPGSIARFDWQVVATSAALLVLSAGCQRQMTDQPRIEPLEISDVFPHGISVRPQVAGTVARGELFDNADFLTGRSKGKAVEALPVELTNDLVHRGQSRFNIFCSPCHGFAGYGDGLVVQRGFPSPPSYHTSRSRSLLNGDTFEAISDGRGRMPAFKHRIEPRDRWAIVAYIRALQLSQHTEFSDLSPENQQLLVKNQREVE